jgi:hypothetical protein
MQITVQNVQTQTISKGGKSRPYGEAKVEYLNERGETKTWTLRSFTNPSVFKTITESPAGTTYEIVTTKNDRDFTEWASATRVAGTSNGATPPAKGTPVAATRSTYETPEERAVRQRLIVRQSSLSNAIEVQKASGSAISLPELLSLAEDFHEWVYKQEEPLPFDNLSEDIPF